MVENEERNTLLFFHRFEPNFLKDDTRVSVLAGRAVPRVEVRSLLHNLLMQKIAKHSVLHTLTLNTAAKHEIEQHLRIQID